ncbi:SRPBCC domain-containing protein [Bacillus sp. FJAT-49705]|uniref:SRPBCC domain-containing protein n=1 Tax=Cytobacillus citreus TaxID=2833586 RepID=A0ABS5NS16_9BACI|nr:SRPBCC domain-containing protein [Cytobacillus citreus]
MEMENKVPDIKKTIIFEAPIQKVWDVVSTSEGIASWFMQNDFQLEVGHEFHIQSPFGPSPCKVLEINAPYHLSFSWDTDGWIVSFTLKEIGDKTEFTLIHGGWNQSDTVVPKAGENAAVIRDRMNGGWEAIVNEKLRKVVEG